MSHLHRAEAVRVRTRSRPRGTVQWVSTGVLAVIWMMVWGRYDLPTLLMGVVLSALVAWVFPLPPLQFSGTWRPHWWGVLVIHLVWQLAVASISVAWAAVVRGPRVRNAVLRVPMRTNSDFVMAQTVELTSLVPGSVVVETRRGDPLTGAGCVYVHVMDVAPEGLDAARESVRRVEARVIRAFGTKEDYLRLQSEGKSPSIPSPTPNGGPT